jgi:DNA polymerase elongation subunit (family B)
MPTANPSGTLATRKGDTPEYVRKMQKELFDCLAQARSREELRLVEAEAREVYKKYLAGLDGAYVKDLVIHRRVGRLIERICLAMWINIWSSVVRSRLAKPMYPD